MYYIHTKTHAKTASSQGAERQPAPKGLGRAQGSVAVGRICAGAFKQLPHFKQLYVCDLCVRVFEYFIGTKAVSDYDMMNMC